MFEFSSTPNEQYILDLAEHRHQFILFLNAYAEDTLSVDMENALFSLALSYCFGDPRLSHVDVSVNNIAGLYFDIVSLLKDEIDTAISLLPEQLSDSSKQLLQDYTNTEAYIKLRWAARSAVDKAFISET